MSATALPRVARVAAAICAAALSCAMPGATHADAAAATAALESAPVEYRIGAEDVIEVSVWRNDSVGRVVPVRPDGMISLPLLNDVQAAGLTPMELRQALTDKLAAFISRPEVSVIVREVHSAKVSVLGEVAHPGRYELHGPTTVLEILARAGGLSPFATKSQIVVLRPRGTWNERIRIDHDRMIASQTEELVVLRGGDLVYVP